MHCLVCGAGGMIGGHLVKRLLADGHIVRAVDIKPFKEWYQFFWEADNRRLDLATMAGCLQSCLGMDWVFQLSADMGGIGFIEGHKAACMQSVLISTHMLQAARYFKVKRFFYSSSACVYPAGKQSASNITALRESDAWPAEPEFGYGDEKIFTERMCRAFHDDYGLDVHIARYHNIFGPCGTWDGGREKAPAALCRKIAQASEGDTIEIWGDGNQTRSFCYIDDCIDGTMRIMQSDYHEPLNLGSNRLVTVLELAQMIAAIAGKHINFKFDVSKPQGVRGRNSDNTLIKQVLGWEPSIPLEVGLEKLYRWVAEQIRISKLSL